MTWLLGLLATIAAVLGAIFLGKRRPAPLPPAPTMESAIERARAERQLADARQVVEIAAARARTQAERDQLLAVLRQPESDEQVARLIEIARRERGE